MRITLFIVFLLIYSINSSTDSINDCDICQLNEYFVPSNGYSCFLTNNNLTLCTCPDRTSTVNKPCRICHRPNICGLTNVSCSEESTFFSTTNNTAFFACFCSTHLFLIGQPCPEETTDTTLLEETTNTPISTATSIEETSTVTISTTNLIQETTTILILTTTLIQETSSSTYITTTVNTSPSTSLKTTTTSLKTSAVSLNTSTSTSLKTTSTTVTTSTTTLMTTATTKCPSRSCSNHLFNKSFLIILINLVYLINKFE